MYWLLLFPNRNRSNVSKRRVDSGLKGTRLASTASERRDRRKIAGFFPGPIVGQDFLCRKLLAICGSHSLERAHGFWRGGQIVARPEKSGDPSLSWKCVTDCRRRKCCLSQR